jgi:hypothetical protein
MRAAELDLALSDDFCSAEALRVMAIATKINKAA